MKYRPILPGKACFGQQRLNRPFTLRAIELRTRLGHAEFPSFAKEGWTRAKENVAKHPLWSGRGGCFKLPLIHSERVWISGGLKQPPRLRRIRNGAVFSMAQPPLLREGG